MSRVLFSYISSRCLFPNHALVLKHGGTRTHVHVHTQPLRVFSEPFCHSDKAITLKGPAPRECYRPCPFSSLRSPCFLTHFPPPPPPPLVFCHSCITTGLYHTPSSYMRHCSQMSSGTHVCAGHSCTSWEGTGGAGGFQSCTHTEHRCYMCKERGRAHRRPERVQHARMHATHT